MRINKIIKIKQFPATCFVILLTFISMSLILAGNLFAKELNSSEKIGDNIYISLQFHVSEANKNRTYLSEEINRIVSDLNEYYLMRGIIFEFEINNIDNSIQTKDKFTAYFKNSKSTHIKKASYNIFVVAPNNTKAKSNVELIKTDYIMMGFGSKSLNERSIMTDKLSQNIALWYTLNNTLKYNLLSENTGANTTYEFKAISDINNDGKGPDISDLAYMINHLTDPSQSEDDVQVKLYDISDVIELVDYLFNK